MLQENVDVFVWWLFQVTRLSQSKRASREQLIRQFVLEWTYISTQILKLVTFISPAALGRVQFSRFNASIFFPTVYYDKTCKFWHLCNPFHRVISPWFSCSFNHFLYVLHCEIRHTVYSITKVCLPVIVRLPVNRFHCICIHCYIVYLYIHVYGIRLILTLDAFPSQALFICWI